MNAVTARDSARPGPGSCHNDDVDTLRKPVAAERQRLFTFIILCDMKGSCDKLSVC